MKAALVPTAEFLEVLALAEPPAELPAPLALVEQESLQVAVAE